MGRVFLMIAVALAVGALVYWSLTQHGTAPTHLPPPVPGSPASGSTTTSPIAEASAPTSTVSTPDTALDPPRTPLQKEREALEQKRVVFYNAVQHNSNGLLRTSRAADDDQGTLEMFGGRPVSQDALSLLNVAFRLNAYRYGFRHMRFFAPNPPGEAERFHLEAEANSDNTGNWNTFRK